MNLKEAEDKYIFYTLIDLPEGDFVKLREPNIAELENINNAKDSNILKEVEKIFPKCLVDHSFTEGDEKANSIDVCNFLKNSGSLFTEIIETWMQSVPFHSRLKKQKT
jgi:hypothetical protein